MKKLILILLFPFLSHSEMYVQFDGERKLQGASVRPLNIIPREWRQERLETGEWVARIDIGKTWVQLDDRGNVDGFLVLDQKSGRGAYYPYNPGCQGLFKR